MSAGHRLIDEITKPGRPQVQQVSDSVYAYIQPDGTWWINNTGFLVGPQGVISIDTCSTERRTRAYRQAIADVTTAPVRTVVNTHHHGDHTFGNCLFPRGHDRRSRAAAGEAMRDERHRRPTRALLDLRSTGAISPSPPFLTFTDLHRLCTLGDLRVELRHVGTPAHTTNDVMSRIPNWSRALLRRRGVQRRHPLPAHGLRHRGHRCAGERPRGTRKGGDHRNWRGVEKWATDVADELTADRLSRSRSFRDHGLGQTPRRQQHLGLAGRRRGLGGAVADAGLARSDQPVLINTSCP